MSTAFISTKQTEIVTNYKLICEKRTSRYAQVLAQQLVEDILINILLLATLGTYILFWTHPLTLRDSIVKNNSLHSIYIHSSWLIHLYLYFYLIKHRASWTKLLGTKWGETLSMEAEPFFFKDKIKFALSDVIAFANQGNLVINKTSC